MRGYNLSSKPKRVRDYRIDILAKDIAELIKKLGNEKAIVVGHDWGGGVAWALATYYPELVRKLVILNVPHPHEILRAFSSLNLTQLRKSYYMFLLQIPKIPEWVIGRNLEQVFAYVFKKASPNSPEASSPDVIAKYVEAYSRPRALTSTINYYREALRALGRMRLKTRGPLPMPVLMLWGEKDVALGKELTLNTKEYCTDFRITYDPSSGHFIQLDNPELVNRKLLEFFEK